MASDSPYKQKVSKEKIKKLDVQLLAAREKIDSAAKRLKFCDGFGRSVEKDCPPPSDLEVWLEAYSKQRKKVYRDHEAATAAADDLRDRLRQAEKEELKIFAALAKASKKATRVKAKEREKKLRARAEIGLAKQRLKAEREASWPKKVYRITINLEPSSMTPAPSRRGSIDGDTIVNLATSEFHEPSTEPLKTGEISLSLSYITHGASWAPRYDLRLNTVKCTGLLEYGAELKNTTSETWRDAKVMLSTSQTSLSGLSESIPSLLPWHVRLEKGARNADGSLFSSLELQAKKNEYDQSRGESAQKSGLGYFGRDGSERNAWLYEKEMLYERKSTVEPEPPEARMVLT
ncbi:hypothetical protein LZ554_004764 [Drepanopeziza brunnea f. sp. 'monogermtubi']|nr:hypothetical protein LZ554_004764 [Drepanopeziza brunnea f. sp. 'monogermtubi']